MTGLFSRGLLSAVSIEPQRHRDTEKRQKNICLFSVSLCLCGSIRAGLLAVVLSLLSGLAQAQTDVRHPDGPLPTELKNPQKVWLAYEGFEPRVLPDMKSDPATGAGKVAFMQAFYTADRRNEEDFHLLVKRGEGDKIEKYVGWVPGRYLTRNEAQTDPDSGIILKALVVNKLESLGNLNQLMIRSAPRKDIAGKDEPYRLYTTLYVYGKGDGYVLVGDEPSFNARRDEDAARAVLGWLPTDRVEIWNTREAVEWDHESTLEPRDRPRDVINAPPSKDLPRRSVPGRIYASRELAQQGLGDLSVKALFEEQFAKDEKLSYLVSPELPPDAPRFPVLRRVANARHPIGGELFEVGGIGGLVDSQGRPLLSSGQVRQLQNLLNAIKEQQTRTDILFVIDDTESMDRWFGVVASTVRKITDLANQDPQRQVRVAVTFYNDVTEASQRENRPPVNPAPLQDARNKGLEIAQMLEKRQREKDIRGGGDPHEMVFRGIIEGIDKANFWPQARKLVVVIGDCGDISAAKRRREQDAEYVKTYSVPAIVERLVPSNLDREAPIEFYAIQVIDPADSDAAGDFQTQMKEIVKQSGDRLRERKKKQLGDKFKEEQFQSPAGYFDPTANRTTSVQSALDGQYARLAQQARDIEDQMKRLGRGQWLTTRLTPDLERQIDRQLASIPGVKVTLDDLRRSSGLQLFQIGYVYENNAGKLPQLRQRVLLNGGELQELISKLRLLDQRGGKEPSLRELVIAVIEKQANTDDRNDPERLKNLSLGGLIKLGGGLKFRSSPMNKKLYELKDKEGSLNDSEYWALVHKYHLLVDLERGEFFKYEARERKSSAGPPVLEYIRHGDRIAKQRGFKMTDKDANVWYYVDYNKEWP